MSVVKVHIICLAASVFFFTQDELKLAVKQGATLLTCIREPVTRSANSKLSPDELENVATVERSVKITLCKLLIYS